MTTMWSRPRPRLRPSKPRLRQTFCGLRPRPRSNITAFLHARPSGHHLSVFKGIVSILWFWILTNFFSTTEARLIGDRKMFFSVDRSFLIGRKHATRGHQTCSENAKMIFRRGSAPEPAGGAHDAPPDPLVGWGGGYPLPISHPPRRLRRLDPRRLRRLEFGALPHFSDESYATGDDRNKA